RPRQGTRRGSRHAARRELRRIRVSTRSYLMAVTPSTMLGLGTPAPDFNLPDVVSGETVSLDTFKGDKALLVMFICRHCPYVKHVERELAQLGRDYEDRELGIVAISANDPEQSPEDAPDSLKEMAETLGF